MSDEESYSDSEFYYPEEEQQAKTEKNSMTKITLTETKISLTVKRNYKICSSTEK